MRTYHVTFGANVGCYCRKEITARNRKHALEIAESMLESDESMDFKPEWDLMDDYRILDIATDQEDA